MTLRIMSYNIMDGPAERLEQIAAVVEGYSPDVLAVQELLDLRAGLALAERLGMNPILAAPMIARANSDPPFDTLWIGIYSNLPVVTVHHHRGRDEIMHRPALEAVLEAQGGQCFSVVNLHLISRLVAAEAERKWSEAQEVKRILENAPAIARCVIGDFNAWMPGEGDLSPGWQMEYPDRYREAVRGGVLATITDAGYVDAWRTCNGATAVAPQSLRDRVGSRVDHVLVSSGMANWLTRCFVAEASGKLNAASDHYPIVADFELATASAPVDRG